MPPLFIGVDVGTGSARAGVFSHEGRLWGSAAVPIKTYRPEGLPLYYQQSSEDIWQQVCLAVRRAVEATAEDPKSGLRSQAEVVAAIKGISFDATCSLVILGQDDVPVTVSPTDHDPQQNIILWLDHRAVEEAKMINGTKHRALDSVGGCISPEMEMPKLKWLKEHLPDSWTRAHKMMDLTDYLTYRSSGKETRSYCTVCCKWNYSYSDKATGGGWDASFLSAIGLDDLKPTQIGEHMASPGDTLGCLSPHAAEDMGLLPSTVVGCGMIDAHAGGVGCIGAAVEGGDDTREAGGGCGGDVPMECRMALICGTSTCHMATSKERLFVPGVWGPYFSAMLPDLWLHEAGQSATGVLLDHVVNTHPAHATLQDLSKSSGRHPHEEIYHQLQAMAARQGLPLALLTRDLHVVPFHQGSRSVIADPELRGMISGLSLDDSLSSLCLAYLATVQALAYNTRLILEGLEEVGHCPITSLFMCGGLSKNDLLVREHADATGCTVHLPRERDGVLLGTAVLAAVASGAYPSVTAGMAGMTSVGRTVRPATGIRGISGGAGGDVGGGDRVRLTAYHQAKYEVFLRMTREQSAYRAIMDKAINGK